MKDQLDSLLLTQSLLDDFKVRAGVSAFGGGKERALCLRETLLLCLQGAGSASFTSKKGEVGRS